MVIGDEKIKNLLERIFYLDVNVILGDGRSWKLGFRIFY